MMIVNTSQTHSKHKIFFSQSPVVGLGLTRVVLALDALILKSLVTICIGFAIGSRRCCELGAAGRSLSILEIPNPNAVARGGTRREMRKCKMCPGPLVGILTKHLHA